MGVIKPVFNNFSSGEITPRLAGRIDLPIYQSSVSRLENFIPDEFGSAKRRGGLQYLATLPDAAEYRIIPWSISNELDVLILLSAGSIRFYSVWRDTNISRGFIADDTGTAIQITHLDSASLVDAYAEAHINEIKYAQGTNIIYLAHNKYPLFFIKYKSYDSTTGYFQFEYGQVGFSGNIAKTPEVIAETALNTDPIVTSQLMSALASIPPDTDIVAPGSYLNGIAVTSVKKTVAGTPRQIGVKITSNILQAITMDHTFFDGEWINPTADYYYVKLCSSTSGAEFATINSNGYPGAGWDKTFSATAIMNAIRGQGAFTCEAKWYGGVTGGRSILEVQDASYATTFTFTMASGGPIVVTSSTTGLTGFITIPAHSVTINKWVTAGAVVMDSVASWMMPNEWYFCDESLPFFGIAKPYLARKVPGGKVYDGNGNLQSDGEPYVEVQDRGGISKKIYPNTTGVTGQLGVNLNPLVRREIGRHPGFVCFHQNRMVIGGSINQPNTVYMSVIGDHTNFQYFEEIQYEKNTVRAKPWTNPDIPEWDISTDTVQQITVDSAIVMRIQTDENEAIQWGASVQDLILGTNTSEWVIPADVTALAPRVALTSRNGSANLQGRFIGTGIVFVSRTGFNLKAFQGQVGTVGESLSAQADHILKEGTGIQNFDFRQDPQTEVYMTLKNGKACAGLLSQQALGFYRISLKSGDLIESIGVINEALEDGVYFVVKRGTVRYLERLATTDDSAFATRNYLDSWVVATKASGNLTGLTRFYAAGTNYAVTSAGVVGTVTVASNGEASQFTPVGGVAATIPTGTVLMIGFPYDSVLTTNRVDAAEIEGSPKTVGAIHMRLYNCGDLQLIKAYNPAPVTLPVDIYMPNTEAGVRVYPYSGPLRVENVNAASVDQYITLKISSHECATIQLIAPSYDVGGQI